MLYSYNELLKNLSSKKNLKLSKIVAKPLKFWGAFPRPDARSVRKRFELFSE